MKKIGLLGGSFDPPHQGHIHLSHRALAAFALDKIWWLVSPQNPLKPPPTHDYPTRLTACQTIATDPRIIIKDWELRIPSPYTIDSLTSLKTRYRTTNFVFLMGADSFATPAHLARVATDYQNHAHRCYRPPTSSNRGGEIPCGAAIRKRSPSHARLPSPAVSPCALLVFVYRGVARAIQHGFTGANPPKNP